MSSGSAARRPGLTREVVSFSRYLRDRGFRVFSSKIEESLRGLQEIDIGRKEDFFVVLRSHLASNDTEWKLFEGYFEAFWNRTGRGEEKEPEEGDDAVRGEFPQLFPAEPSPGGAASAEVTQDLPAEVETQEGGTFSPVPNLEKQNLSGFRKGDIQIAQLILKHMISLFRLAAAHRSNPSKKSDTLDFRRITAKSLRTGGIPLELFYRKKKKRLKKLVVLADVSGSMDRYTRFVIPFILGLRGVGNRAEVFVFSTSLTSVSPYLRRYPFDKALEVIARETPDWSGGTRIGESLRQFNEDHGERLLNRRTVVVIMSDGWDLGAKPILEKAMETLNRKTACILWLNPLPVDSEDCVLARGMRTALPYIHHFLPAHSLESLRKVGKTLSEVMIQH